VGPRAGLDDVDKRKFLTLLGLQLRPLGLPTRSLGWDGMDWIDLAKHRDQWRALVNKVMNLLVP
jgi:hypothetical protein